MKRTIREFGVCWSCKGRGGRTKNPTDESDVNWIICKICHGKKQIILKETIEESDGKEFYYNDGLVDKATEELRKQNKEFGEFIDKRYRKELVNPAQQGMSGGTGLQGYSGIIRCRCPEGNHNHI